MIKVSIIVPVYNTEEYLRQCLNSIINQTLKDIEIICVDDGSTDNSLAILKRYAAKDNRIKVLSQENQGQSIARNNAINIATGEYIGFVDSDDWVDLDYFDKMYNTAKKYNADIACAGYKRCKKKHFKIRKKFKIELVSTNVNEKVKLDKIPKDNYVWNKIYKRETWLNNEIQFEPKHYYEDIALVTQILNKFNIMVTVPRTYYNYRYNPSSTVNQKTEKHISDYNWAINELTKYTHDNNIRLPKNKIILRREVYKIFNITLLKTYYYDNLIVSKLFGFIPCFTKKVVNNEVKN